MVKFRFLNNNKSTTGLFSVSSQTIKNKNAIIEWLKIYNVKFDMHITKAKLSELIKTEKQSVLFAMVTIASKFDHRLLFIPLYYCELQLIEIV